ncbi:glycosyltransferase family 4 protein [Halobacillus kuroshimensis]|uniref:glycosyltransferase family 4 protein n=1 Tax=Halobacillus kuroshimensis TaxID=302481 RepID=UPI0003FB656D|nr:glycosyltransferase family 4 protein [Halobacillus kuroshimensis]
MQQPLQVAYLDHAEEMGGAEFSLYYLIKEIDKESIHPHLIVPNESPLREKVYHHPSVTIAPHSMSSLNIVKRPMNGLSFFRDLYRLTFYIKKHIDVVHTNTYRSAVYGLIAGKMAGKKTVWHVRDLHDSLLFKKVMPYFADHIIAISRAVAHQFSEDVFRKKGSIVYNGVDFSEYQLEHTKGSIRAELNIPQEAVLIGMVGRMTAWKGYHHLIEALPKVIRQAPHVRVVIVGGALFASDDYIKQLKQMVKERELQNHVCFLGHREDIPNIMKSLDIFISYSEEEPFGRVIIEALAMETPVIVADSGGAPEIIENGNCGVIAPSGSPEALTAAILSVVDEEGKLRELGSNGRRWVKEKFNTRKVGREIYQTYESLSVPDKGKLV